MTSSMLKKLFLLTPKPRPIHKNSLKMLLNEFVLFPSLDEKSQDSEAQKKKHNKIHLSYQEKK